MNGETYGHFTLPPEERIGMSKIGQYDGRTDEELQEAYRTHIAVTPKPSTVSALKAPDRATTLPTVAKERKEYPIASGVLDYFPDALAEVAHVSFVGNEQHNPGQPLHWDRAKSTDEADALARHLVQRGGRDSDGIRHSAKVAWRALALLQKELEQEGQ